MVTESDRMAEMLERQAELLEQLGLDTIAEQARERARALKLVSVLEAQA